MKYSGWFVSVVALGSIVYLKGMHDKEKVYQELSFRKDALLEQKKQVEEEHQDLLLHVHSESDPAWMELVLMKRLGLVPEDQVKVYFSPIEDKK